MFFKLFSYFAAERIFHLMGKLGHLVKHATSGGDALVYNNYFDSVMKQFLPHTYFLNHMSRTDRFYHGMGPNQQLAQDISYACVSSETLSEYGEATTGSP